MIPKKSLGLLLSLGLCFGIALNTLPSMENVGSIPGIRHGTRDIFEAIKKGYPEAVAYWLEHGTDINAQDKKDWPYLPTPLIAAINNLKSNLGGNIVKLLLSRNANTEATNSIGDTALIVAAKMGVNTKLFQLLLDNHASVKAQNKDGDTALHVAAEDERIHLMRLLIKNQALIESRDNNGNTPLIVAAQNGRTKSITTLLANDADIEAQNNSGETPLLAAAKYGKINAVQLLLDTGANPKATTNSGNTLLALATRGQQLDIIDFLLRKPGLTDISSIIKDAQRKKAEKVQSFLAYWENDKQETLLISCVRTRDIPSIQSLIAFGANPYQEDSTSQNAFDYAQQLQEPERQAIIDLLLTTKHEAPKQGASKTKDMQPIIKRMQRLHTPAQEEEKEEAAAAPSFAAWQNHAPTLVHYQLYSRSIEAAYPNILTNRIVKECLAKEEDALRRGYRVFYRSEPGGELTVYEYFIYYLRQLLSLSTTEFPFIYTRFVQNSAPQETINDYQDRVKPMFERSPKVPNVLLSANIPLLGNINLPDSCTWHYFSTNKSQEPINVRLMLTDIFETYGFDKKYINALLAIGEKTKGIPTLHQILIPNTIVDDVVMLAKPGYNIPVDYQIDNASWNQEKKRHTRITPMLDLYATDPAKIKDEWQARILATALTPERDIQFYPYNTLSSKATEQLKKQVKHLSDIIFTEWLERELRRENIPSRLISEKLGNLFAQLGKQAHSEEEAITHAAKQTETVEASKAAGHLHPELKIATAKEAAGQARVKAIFPHRKIPKRNDAPSVLSLYTQNNFILDKNSIVSAFTQDTARDQERNNLIPARYRGDNLIRIATYNVHQWEDSYHRHSYQAILDTIQSLNADIVILQEVTINEKIDPTHAFKTIGFDHQSFMLANNDYNFGNMIISKHPFIEPPTHTTYKAQHIGSADQRNVINARIQTPSGIIISVYGTHLDAWQESGVQREKEVAELLRIIQKDPHPNVLIAGDFNAIREQDYRYKIPGKPPLTAWEILTKNFAQRQKNPAAIIPTAALDLLSHAGFTDSFTQAALTAKQRKLFPTMSVKQLANALMPTYTVWTGTVVDFIFCAPTWNLPIAGSYVYYGGNTRRHIPEAAHERTTPPSDHLPVIIDIEILPQPQKGEQP